MDGIEDEEFIVVSESGLNERQRLFVHAYMRHRSATQAVIDAGYRVRIDPGRAIARQAAYQLMQKPKIRELIEALFAARMRRLQATPQTIEEELVKVAFASLGQIMVVQQDGTAYLDFNRADEATLAGLTKFRCEISHKPGDAPDEPKQVLKMEAQLGDKLGALRTLAQIHKMIGSDGAVDSLVDIATAIREGRKRAGLD